MNLQATSTNLSQKHVLKVSESSLTDNSIKETLTKFWSLESMEIHPDDENAVHESFLTNIKFDGTRYEVKLPFNPMSHGLFLSSNCTGGGELLAPPHRKPTSTLNFLTKFGMYIGLCMNIKFQF